MHGSPGETSSRLPLLVEEPEDAEVTSLSAKSKTVNQEFYNKQTKLSRMRTK